MGRLSPSRNPGGVGIVTGKSDGIPMGPDWSFPMAHEGGRLCPAGIRADGTHRKVRRDPDGPGLELPYEGAQLAIYVKILTYAKMLTYAKIFNIYVKDLTYVKI